MKRTIAMLAAVSLLAALLPAGAAMAQQSPAGDRLSDPTSAQYDDEFERHDPGERVGDPNGDPGDRTGPQTIGALPFTGHDLVGLLLVTAALLGLGFGLRRLSAPH